MSTDWRCSALLRAVRTSILRGQTSTCSSLTLPGHQSGIAAHQNALDDLLGRPVELVMEAAVENPFVRAGINGSRQAIYAA